MSEQLPIDAIKGEVTAASQARPLVVVAPTGSGKSTRLPLWLAEQTEGRVLVVEPRRVACRALASYLSEQKGEPVGQSIGYQVRFEARRSEQTRILFVTPGMALRLLDSQPWSICLIDEFHERQWEVDLLVALLRHRARLAQEAGQRGPWLALTSATIEGKGLAADLDATLLEAEGRSFPVSVSHLGDVTTPTKHGLEERVSDAVARCLKQAPKGDASARDDGDVLIFLPGKGEIEGCKQALQGIASRGGCELVPVHGSLPMSQLARALSPHADKRRIYLATNVAETSLTLPRVTTVIDAGLVRMRLHRSGRSALALVPVTHSQMTQRAGRAGRVAPGRCIRLWDERFQPSTDTRPEIERIELDDLVLQAATYGLDGAALAAAPWVSAPPAFALEAAQQRLHQIGALDADAASTPSGRELARWPLSALEARLVVGAPEALAPSLADLVALLQQHGSLLLSVAHLPQDRREAVVEARRELLDACLDEVMAALVLLRRGDGQRHALHSSRLQQARAIARQLRQKLSLDCVDPTHDRSPLPERDTLAAWILQRAPQLGFVRRKRADRPAKGRKRPRQEQRHTSEPWANGEIELMVEPYLPTDPEQKRHVPKAGVILGHSWISARGLQVQGRGQMLLPCRLETLAEAGLGEAEIGALKLTKRGSIKIEAEIVTSLAGIPLVTRQTVPSGAALREAVVSLMLEGRLWREALGQVLDQLHLLALLSSWPPPRSWESHPDAKEWLVSPEIFLTQRLKELGLESVEELALIEAEDLLPDVEGWLGIDAYSLEEFASDFPRQWEFQGAIYDCFVSPARRKVRLEPHNKQARQGKDPAARLLPGFRGFRVEYQKASRLVTLR